MAAAAYYLRSQYSKYVFIDSGSCNWCTQLSNRSRPIFCRITRLQRSISGNGSANIRNWGGKKEKKLLYFCFAYFLNFFFFGFVQSLSQASQHLTHFITQTRSTFVIFRWIRKKNIVSNYCTPIEYLHKRSGLWRRSPVLRNRKKAYTLTYPFFSKVHLELCVRKNGGTNIPNHRVEWCKKKKIIMKTIRPTQNETSAHC